VVDIRRIKTVPPVASDATAPAYKPSLPNPAWAAPSSGRTTDSPFDALLDDSTQAAAQAPQSPPPPRDKTQPKAQPVSDQDTVQETAQASAKAPAKATDNSTDQTTDSSIGDAIAAVTAIKEFKAVKPSQDVKNDKKAGEPTAADVDLNLTGTGKQADFATPANAIASTANNPIQTAIPATVIAPVVVAQDTPATVLQTVAAIGHLSITGADTTKTKPANSAEAKTDSAKLSADVNASVKNADGKLQTVAGDVDKQVVAPQQPVAQSGKSHTNTAPELLASAPDAQLAATKVDGSAIQQTALSVPTLDASQAAAAPAVTAPHATQALAVPLAGVAIEIAGKALEGKNHFEIRLDPPELGRIEVRLAVDKDGNTTTHMIADRSDTLNLLRNDSSDLQRALQDAGLKTSDNGMQFSLRDQSMGQQQSNTPAPGAAQIVVNDNTLAAIDLTPRSYARLAGMGGGIDIRV
jgi:chemotaxis protein MotD